MSILDKLAKGAPLLSAKQEALYHALCMAIVDDDVRAVNDALKKGADPNIRPDLQSPLFLAMNRNRRILDTLIYAGAEFNAQDEEKRKELGAEDPTLKYIDYFQKKFASGVGADEFGHEYQIDLDLARHQRMVKSLQRNPATTGLAVSHKGLVVYKSKEKIPETSPTDGFAR